MENKNLENKSNLWHILYNTVSKIPRKDLVDDASDASSVTTELEIVFNQLLQGENIKKLNINNNYIDDLSYSNIANIVQGENIKGADLINNLALEKEELEVEINELESKLKSKRSRKSTLLSAAYNVAKHLKKDLPLAVSRSGYIVVLTDENLTIEKNVI